MKKITSLFFLFVIAIGVPILFEQTTPGETAGGAEAKTLYTCGMHPQIIQDHPGNCPICGMKLVTIRKESIEGSAATNSSAIALDAVTIQNMNLKTTQISRGLLRRSIHTVGTIEHSETGTVDITTKFRGWVEKLLVDSTGQLVHRGEPMFEIYSPEIFSAETEYVLALSSATGTNDTLKEIARRKLSYLDISDSQIAELEKTRAPAKTVSIASPIDGYVMEKMVVQGQMVEPGMKLYELVNHDTIWVLAKVYEQDLPLVRLGQESLVSITSLPGAQFRGRVTFIYPTLDEKTRAATARLEFHNPGHLLKPGMFASVQINAETERTALLVPDSAVLRSGERNTVFVALDGGKFDPRNVVLGAEAEDGMDEVISGLNEGERVVASGQFMLDSESQLREAIEKMRGVESSNRGVVKSAASAAIQPIYDSTNLEPVVYVCPMPEHVSIIYDHAGKCPICGMELVPVKRGELEKLQPGGVVLYYTCPMPEHASVHQSKPGKCPLCGMTLIPVMTAPTNLPPAKMESSKTNSFAPTVQTNSAAKLKSPQIYVCPMHPTVVSNAPGKCPECEMDLVPTNPEK